MLPLGRRGRAPRLTAPALLTALLTLLGVLLVTPAPAAPVDGSAGPAGPASTVAATPVPAPRAPGLVVDEPGPAPSGTDAAAGAPAAGTHVLTDTAAVPVSSTSVVTGPAATFVVSYDAGFTANAPARASFEAALQVWSATISSTVPIEVQANFGTTDCGGSTFGPNVIGGAGPDSFTRDWPAAPGVAAPPAAGVWYASGLANAVAGSDLFPGQGDICAAFNSAFTNFYFGTDGAVPITSLDFESLVLHEIGHGLGFVGSVSLASGNPNQAECCFNGLPFSYDRFVTLGDGTPVISLPHPSTTLLTALTGGDLFFRGPAVVLAAGLAGARLYAPATFSQGSSFSHLDEATYQAASGNGLMTPSLSRGEVEHRPGPLATALMTDLGWPSAPPPPPPPSGLFHPLSPTRVLDTRNGTGRNGVVGKVGPLGIVRLGFDSALVPTTATAVVISLVATNGTANSLLTVWPDDGGTTIPTLSNVNFGANQTINNLVSARVDATTHRIAIANLNGSTDMVADVLGYYDDGNDPTGQRYRPLDPVRVVDTRTGTGTGGVIAKIGPGGILRTGFTGAPASIPSTATAAVLSVVSTNSTVGSFLTVFPDDGATTIPNTSNVNFPPGATVNNLVMVKIDPVTHRVAIGNKLGGTDVVADLVGYFDPGSGGSRFVGLDPTRVLDTRIGVGTGAIGKLGAGSLPLAFGAVPADATAVVISLVATNGTANSFLTVWPDNGTAAPNASMVNFGAGATVNNLVSSKIDPVTHRVRIQNLAGATDLVADLLGYYTP